MRTTWRGVSVVWLGLATAACSEDEPVVAERGAPSLTTPASDGAAKPKPAAKGKGKAAEADAAAEGDAALDAGPPRPPVALDSKSFVRRRDPFASFVATEMLVPEPALPRADRPVEMAKYAFEDLKLIAIVNSGRGLTSRALFLASDGKSQTIAQGEYFSSAEVLLAAVNRDYVEIEVVDDDLATSLNLQRGERRAIYLRND